MTRLLRPSFLSLVTAAALVSGCDQHSDNPDVRTAEEAVGVNPDQNSKKTAEATREVTVVKDTKVIDNRTGKTLSEKTESTPVKIIEEKREKTEVNVDVGTTKAATTGGAQPSSK